MAGDQGEQPRVFRPTLNLLGLRGMAYEMAKLEERLHLEREDAETGRTLLHLWVHLLLEEGSFAG